MSAPGASAKGAGGRVLVADVGGTNARFALSDAIGSLRFPRTYLAAEHPTFEEALSAYLTDAGVDTNAHSIARANIAAAGPVENNAIDLTNSPWRISAKPIAEISGCRKVSLFNDLEAVALLLPHLSASQTRAVGLSPLNALEGNKLALNVGTGLGAASALFLRNGSWQVSATEAGHMTFAAREADEVSLLLPATSSAEDLLSGAGVLHLYHLLAEQETTAKTQAAPATAAQVFEIATTDPVAAKAMQILADYLARIAGDLVLAHGAWGGVYLCGSVARSICESADPVRFREVFTDKGKMTERMAHVRSDFIVEAEPALMGLTYVRPPV